MSSTKQDAIEINRDFYERANWDVLWLIKLFDKYNRISILNAAEDLLNWIIGTDDKTTWHNVWRFNQIQIKLRKENTLETSDHEWLLDQEETIPTATDIDDSQKIQTLFSIQVLLSDYHKATRIFDKMSSDEKEFITGLPIFQLYQNLINNNNG